MHAAQILQAGLQHMQDRANTYDKPEGERSMGMTVALANVLLADKLRTPLSEEDGWNFMELLKLVRSKQGEFKADNYEDRAAYAGLAGEAAHHERVPPVMDTCEPELALAPAKSRDALMAKAGLA